MFSKPTIKKNIAITDDVVQYWYEITPISILYSSEAMLEYASQASRILFSELNMAHAIYIVPVSIDSNKILDFHELMFNKYSREELREDFDAYQKDVAASLQKNTYRYAIYLCALDGNPALTRITPMKKLLNDVEDHKKMIEIAEIYEPNITKKISFNFNGTKPARSCQIISVYEHLKNAEIDSRRLLNRIEYRPTNRMLEFVGINKDHSEQSLFVSYSMIKDAPAEIRPQKFITQFQELDFPVTVIVKTDFVEAKKAQKEATIKKHEIQKDIKFERREYETEGVEYFKPLHAAMVGERCFKLSDDAQARTQIMFRVFASTEDYLHQRTDVLEKIVKSSGMEFDACLGKQRKLFFHSFPYQNYYNKNILYTTLKGYANFNLLCGYKIGEEVGSYYAHVASDNTPVLTDLHKVINHEKVNQQLTTIIVASTRGGKTYFQNTEIFRNLPVYGMRTLIIEPKPDERRKAFEKLSYRERKHIVYFDVLGKESKGWFDPLFINKNDRERAYLQTLTDTKNLLAAIDKKMINYRLFKECFDIWFNAYENSKIKTLTYPMFLRFLKHVGEEKNDDNLVDVADSILALEDMPMAHLFFADENTNYMFDETKNVFVAEIAGLPDISKFKSHDLSHVFTSMLYDKIDILCREFMTWKPNELSCIIFEEYSTFKQSPTGKDTVRRINRLCSTYNTFLVIVMQNLSDADTEDEQGLFNNAGQFLIGVVDDPDEIDFIIKKLQLDPSQRDLFNFKKSQNSSNEKMKYRFLLIDWDKQIATIKATPINQNINEAFDTRGVDKK